MAEIINLRGRQHQSVFKRFLRLRASNESERVGNAGACLGSCARSAVLAATQRRSRRTLINNLEGQGVGSKGNAGGGDWCQLVTDTACPARPSCARNRGIRAETKLIDSGLS